MNYDILLNNLFYSNFTHEYINKNGDLIDNIHYEINGEKIFGSNSYIVSYMNWIKNNI